MSRVTAGSRLGTTQNSHEQISTGRKVEWQECIRCHQLTSMEQGHPNRDGWRCFMNSWNPSMAFCMNQTAFDHHLHEFHHRLGTTLPDTVVTVYGQQLSLWRFYNVVTQLGGWDSFLRNQMLPVLLEFVNSDSWFQAGDIPLRLQQIYTKWLLPFEKDHFQGKQYRTPEAVAVLWRFVGVPDGWDPTKPKPLAPQLPFSIWSIPTDESKSSSSSSSSFASVKALGMLFIEANNKRLAEMQGAKPSSSATAVSQDSAHIVPECEDPSKKRRRKMSPPPNTAIPPTSLGSGAAAAASEGVLPLAYNVDYEKEEIGWVCCDDCGQWCSVERGYPLPGRKQKWKCPMNIWNPQMAVCQTTEQFNAKLKQCWESHGIQVVPMETRFNDEVLTFRELYNSITQLGGCAILNQAVVLPTGRIGHHEKTLYFARFPLISDFRFHTAINRKWFMEPFRERNWGPSNIVMKRLKHLYTTYVLLYEDENFRGKRYDGPNDAQLLWRIGDDEFGGPLPLASPIQTTTPSTPQPTVVLETKKKDEENLRAERLMEIAASAPKLGSIDNLETGRTKPTPLPTKNESSAQPQATTNNNQRTSTASSSSSMGGGGSVLGYEPVFPTEVVPPSAMAARRVEYVGCDRCGQWSTVENGVDLPPSNVPWYCDMNTWNPNMGYCVTKDEFLSKLREFYTSIGEDTHLLEKLPIINGEAADLWFLYNMVTQLGGYDTVHINDWMGVVSKEKEIWSSAQNIKRRLKEIYVRYLLKFEREFFKGKRYNSALEGALLWSE